MSSTRLLTVRFAAELNEYETLVLSCPWKRFSLEINLAWYALYVYVCASMIYKHKHCMLYTVQLALCMLHICMFHISGFGFRHYVLGFMQNEG